MNRLLKPKSKKEIHKDFENSDLLRKFTLIRDLVIILTIRMDLSFEMDKANNYERIFEFFIIRRTPLDSPKKDVDTFGTLTMSTNSTTGKTYLYRNSKEIFQFDRFGYNEYKKIENFLENIKTFEEFMNM